MRACPVEFGLHLGFLRRTVCIHDGFPFGDRVHRVGHGKAVERHGGQQPARMLHRYAVGLSDVALVADDLVEHGLGRRQTADHVRYALPSPRCLGLSIGVSWACSTTWRRSSSSSAFTIGCSCAPHAPTHCASVERATVSLMLFAHSDECITPIRNPKSARPRTADGSCLWL